MKKAFLGSASLKLAGHVFSKNVKEYNDQFIACYSMECGIELQVETS